MRVPARHAVVIALIAAPAWATGCTSSSQPTPVSRDFVLDVSGERFVLRANDAETARLAAENLQGRNNRFPIGPLRAGDGGFNSPWTWHFDPDAVRFVEAAVEVCDGRPSYVEAHQADYPTYCPWGAHVVSQR